MNYLGNSWGSDRLPYPYPYHHPKISKILIDFKMFPHFIVPWKTNSVNLMLCLRKKIYSSNSFGGITFFPIFHDFTYCAFHFLITVGFNKETLYSHRICS
jgi:hypothetical protein